MSSRRSFLAGIGGLAAVRAAPALAQATAASNPRVTLGAATVTRGDGDYELQRRSAVWQAIKPERYPDLIVQARDERDVVETVRHARRRGTTVAVRGSGHSYVAAYLHNGGILLDVSRLQRIDIDPAMRTASVQPGVRGAQLAAALDRRRLAFPVPHARTVTMGGYLLGGGMGWNGEYWNRLACFNVRAVDVVTADGEQRRISAREDPDLFWAARGAGPAFCAVATRFHLEVFPLPRAITASTFIYSLHALSELSAWIEHSAACSDPGTELTLVLQSDEQTGEPVCIVSAVSFADSDAQARSVLGALGADAPAAGRLAASELQPMSFEQLLAAARTEVPRRVAVDTVWTGKPARAMQAIENRFSHAPSPETVVIANYRANVTPLDEAAYSAMAPLFINVFASWDDQARDAENFDWLDETMRALQPITDACYVNETDFMRRPERARRCFSPENWHRLRAVRADYDTAGMFRAPFALTTES